MSNFSQRLESNALGKAFSNCSKLFKLIIVGLMVFIWGYLSISSLLETTRLEATEPTYELSTYNRDSFLLNVVFLVCIYTILKCICKDAMSRINTKVFTAILCAYTLGVALFWVLSVKSTAMHDSYMITSTAEKVVNGDYSAFDFESEKYFYEYPFQLGYVLVCQVVNTLFKGSAYLIALQVLNIVSLEALFLGVIHCTKYVFDSKEVTNTTILFLFGFISVMLFTTFIYGNLLGFALSTWAVTLEVKYIRTDKKYLMFVSAILIGLSIMVKSNNMIVLLAMCIILVIKFLDTKKLWDIVSIAICVVLGLNVLNCAIGYYERKADVDFGSGIPKILWLDMGLHESAMACGWYNYSYTVGIYENNDYDPVASTQEGISQIKEQLSYFYNDQSYANRFFSEKILSQWNEPSYDSIWVSQMRGHLEDPPQYVNEIYYGNAGEYLLFYMDQYQQVVYVLAFIGLVAVAKKKDSRYYVIPLIVLGGFLYHLLFEAKAQYVITYVTLLIPISAYGMQSIVHIDFRTKFKALIRLGASES